MHGTARIPSQKKKSAKAFWLKQLHTWHWVSSAISLIGLLLFAFTGITLNHAADIEGSPQTVEKAATLPANLRAQIAPDDQPDTKKPLPAPVAAWIEQAVGQRGTGEAEWSADEIYLALPRPGGDGWVSIDRADGTVTSEATSRGWISYLNDLHKGRNAGTVWKWFIDIFSVACFLFALTGLVLLQLHAKKRPSTWPLVAAGLALPAILAIIFIH
ncbi:PepSY-associated TM helix domain-containing protein [Sphingobium sp. RAC03]|uniref:PepSY-associated TM helix domain-containing protein n=1 Tax=Sphingobium sp. RAC03 TaxID=1843368 RepID=UPI00083CC6F3|nr:PepSY-associated TM helix domain-containing protein [Sphingobium sp. RAC03]AOF96577.1 pepSY-associated TM helix family protein [Sphingobium sp. RAC03]